MKGSGMAARPGGAGGYGAGAPGLGVRRVPAGGGGGLARGPGRGSAAEPAYDPDNEVARFLGAHGFEAYTAAILEQGFDDLETLAHIEDSDLRHIGMPTMPAAKLKMRIQELRRQMACDPNDPNHPVVAFLSSIGLGQYAEALLTSGFDDMDTLCMVEDADLRDLGVLRGHAVKLRNRLRDYELSALAEDVPSHGPGGTRRPVATPQMGAWRSSARSTTSSVLSDDSAPRPAPVVRRAAPVLVKPPPRPELPSASMRSAVDRSWEKVQAVGSQVVGELLYRHTFELEPSAALLFPPEVRRRYREWTQDEASEAAEDDDDIYKSAALKKLFSKFINAIGCTVAGLSDMTRLVPMLTKLGARHLRYGVGEEHFAVMGQALALTLRDVLKEEMTSDVEVAWTTVYNFMTGIMMEGLRQAKEASEVVQPPTPDCRSVGSTVSTFNEALEAEEGPSSRGSSGAAAAARAFAVDVEGRRQALGSWAAA